MRGKPFALTFAGPRGGSETGDVMSVMKLNQEAGRSFSGVLLFWWILFVVLQKAERLFLLVQASFQETAATDVLVKTLMTGLRGDLIVASLAIGLCTALALLGGAVQYGVAVMRATPFAPKTWVTSLSWTCRGAGVRKTKGSDQGVRSHLSQLPAEI